MAMHWRCWHILSLKNIIDTFKWLKMINMYPCHVYITPQFFMLDHHSFRFDLHALPPTLWTFHDLNCHNQLDVKYAEDLAKPEKKLKSSHSSESAVKSSYNNQAIWSSIFSVGSAESIIVENERLYFASRWSLIAGRLPGRTDNEIKNHRITYLSKKLKINDGEEEEKKHPH